MNYLVLFVSTVFCVLRIALPSEGLQRADIFKDLAHVWVGMVLGAAILAIYYELPPRAFLWGCFVGLCTVEVLAVLGG